MNKELLEKLSAIREDLVAFQAQVSDVKKLADLLKQKVPTMERNYRELIPYMTIAQWSRSQMITAFTSVASCLDDARDENYLRTVEDGLTRFVMEQVPRLIADLDDIAEKGRGLLELILAIREDLLAFKAQVTAMDAAIIAGATARDVKKLADLVKQKAPMIQRNYEELYPYMTAVYQRDRAGCGWFAFEAAADSYFQTGKDHLTGAVNSLVPLMIADLDDIAKVRKLKQPLNPKTSG